ncbi:MAG: TonB-dependent receptor [Bacteroidia bacterium]
MNKIATFSILFLLVQGLFAQTGSIRGRVFDEINNQGLIQATVFLQNTEIGAYTDSLGNFELNDLKPGLYNIEVSYLGYNTRTLYEIQALNGRPYYLEIPMKEETQARDSVVITASVFKKPEEAPLSLRTIGTSEIQRTAGGNRDISRAIQSLPGVATTAAFRNDILIRGGAPNENRFYLDDVEVPNINHFATQGGSGGPVGMINVDFINEVDFYSGAFPANRGNALSSVFNFKQREARKDRVGVTATVGASDLAATIEGPVGKKSATMFSVRASYLQFLFKALQLPFLPTYYDWQFKHKIKIDAKNEINVISLGSLDLFKLNLEDDETEYQKYLLGNLPVQNQWSYTLGTTYKHYGEKGFWTVVASRNMINFDAYKYRGNDKTQEKLFEYNSQESENKFRIENTTRLGSWKFNVGTNAEYVRYSNDFFNKRQFFTIDYNAKMYLWKYGLFGQVSKSLLDDRMTLSFGTRFDGSNYNKNMANPLNQFSPRFSASYAITDKLAANFNTGMYYQLPAYTVLGHRDSNTGELANQDRMKFMKNTHIVTGLAYTSPANYKISVEGFYKVYNNYPYLLTDSISLANFGGGFDVFVGNEPAASISKGRSYGVEFLAQQRLYKGFYGIVAYTLVWSEFDGKKGFVPSAWDSRHIVSLTGGKKLPKNWEIGVRWRFATGSPYTPTDSAASSSIASWNLLGQGIPDYTNLNSVRLQSYHKLDVRIDKRWYFKKWNLNAYVDMQNVYNYKIPGAPILTVQRDEAGNPLVNPTNPQYYQTYYLQDQIGLLQPGIGIIVSY